MITHRQALEAIKVLSAYCEANSCEVGKCICIDIEQCPIRILTAKEMQIITEETERFELKEKHE